MADEITEAQRAARQANALKAQEGRRVKAAERAAGADAAIEAAYRPVLDELDEALANPHRGASHCRRALMLLARVAAGPHYDPTRSRSIAAAINAAYAGGLAEAGAYNIDQLPPLKTR